ncbi:MAG: thioredoxin domain-containing protein [Terracidiphilus sp.]
MYSHPMHKDVIPAPAESAPTHTNLLEQSASSYLRSARHQPVQWHPWSDAAFAKAQSEDKPILLDIGAVWCHWCHVMDRESYENPEIAAIINEHFVAVKVDRDERPDIDARYQAAVSAISGQGGWPLTAFLTPDGRPYFGGTYIPPDDRYGRPGFARVLTALSHVWRERRDEALETAASVMAAIEHNESFSSRGGEPTLALVDKIAGSILSQFDPRNGGFGSQPKFPHPAALDLLLEVGMNRGNQQAIDAFSLTLEKMARGGVYDHLAGGFHRYSVDEHWRVPHFEKMLYDNTELLRNYLHGYQSLRRKDFLVVAREIVDWLEGTMSDRERGGFYASQDADINLDDDGDYFTWTLAEARDALQAAGFSADESKIALRYWDLRELGDMHHNPAKNVLHIDKTLEELAAETSRSVDDLRQVVDKARRTLLAARSERPTPFIDRTLYTGWNAMAVTACLEAARVLGRDSTRKFALLTLDRLLREAWDGARSLAHVIAYGDQSQAQPPETPPATLDDYAFTVQACVDAWFSTGEMTYYHAAVKLADAMIARFYDKQAGAFFDAAAPADGATPLGALAARRKPLQDTPTPAGNPTAASALLRLETLSGRSEYRAIAEETLAFFTGIVEHLGLYAGSYGLALERLLLDPVQAVVIGSGPQAEHLEARAIASFAVNRTVMRIDPQRLVPGGIPEALAEVLLQVPRPAGADAWAIICRGRTCLPPVTDAEALEEALSVTV